MGNKKDYLGDRMKENYENRAKTYLIRRTPVIIRLDGKAFHTFTKHLQKPYDKVFHNAMNATMKYLCENIQGCKIGYTQSDEITLFLTDYDTLTTEAWFGYNVQKMCSVAASMATLAFNKALKSELETYQLEWSFGFTPQSVRIQEEHKQYVQNLADAVEKGAMFDARCFTLPKEEVINCFIWRQQDATRNAIQMLGQCNFTHKELQGKSCVDIQDMLMTQKGINFNNMPTEFKRGVCCIKKEIQNPNVDIKDGYCPRTVWVLDKEIPIFTQDRDYIERLVMFDDD